MSKVVNEGNDEKYLEIIERFYRKPRRIGANADAIRCLIKGIAETLLATEEGDEEQEFYPLETFVFSSNIATQIYGGREELTTLLVLTAKHLLDEKVINQKEMLILFLNLLNGTFDMELLDLMDIDELGNVDEEEED